MYIICLNFDHCGVLVTVKEPGPLVTECPQCGSLRLQFNNKHELINTINSSEEEDNRRFAILARIIDKITTIETNDE